MQSMELEREAHETMAAINQAWLEGNPSAMSKYLHPDIVMVFPGFAGSIAGRAPLLASFEEFCSNARVLQYLETVEQIYIVGNTAVVSFHFDMLYERSAYREHSSGRDVWVFERCGESWIAVWRTMQDLREQRETDV